ncbi:MAG: hypothetical protein MJK14_25105, partial [Rivularia sp. ALOHA_DT_140]|nr:hypothetical protein [Rivularia sp. ALOHA_DT_140]
PGDRITECVFGNHHAGIIIPENVKILNGFYRLIEAATVMDNLIGLCPNGTQNELEVETFVLPTNERQVR